MKYTYDIVDYHLGLISLYESVDKKHITVKKSTSVGNSIAPFEKIITITNEPFALNKITEETRR